MAAAKRTRLDGLARRLELLAGYDGGMSNQVANWELKLSRWSSRSVASYCARWPMHARISSRNLQAPDTKTTGSAPLTFWWRLWIHQALLISSRRRFSLSAFYCSTGYLLRVEWVGHERRGSRPARSCPVLGHGGPRLLAISISGCDPERSSEVIRP
jgi:hypothetical protein